MELRGFLGTDGAICQFLPSFAQHDAPLRKLLHEQNDFVWTDSACVQFRHSRRKSVKTEFRSNQFMGEDEMMAKLNVITNT